MSEKPISDLRRRMLEDMAVRKFGDKTKHAVTSPRSSGAAEVTDGEAVGVVARRDGCLVPGFTLVSETTPIQVSTSTSALSPP